jgi:hypothetical protein
VRGKQAPTAIAGLFLVVIHKKTSDGVKIPGLNMLLNRHQRSGKFQRIILIT